MDPFEALVRDVVVRTSGQLREHFRGCTFERSGRRFVLEKRGPWTWFSAEASTSTHFIFRPKDSLDRLFDLILGPVPGSEGKFQAYGADRGFLRSFFGSPEHREAAERLVGSGIAHGGVEFLVAVSKAPTQRPHLIGPEALRVTWWNPPSASGIVEAADAMSVLARDLPPRQEKGPLGLRRLNHRMALLPASSAAVFVLLYARFIGDHLDFSWPGQWIFVALALPFLLLLGAILWARASGRLYPQAWVWLALSAILSIVLLPPVTTIGRHYNRKLDRGPVSVHSARVSLASRMANGRYRLRFQTAGGAMTADVPPGLLDHVPLHQWVTVRVETRPGFFFERWVSAMSVGPSAPAPN